MKRKYFEILNVAVGFIRHLEDVNSKLSLLFEGHQLLDNKIESVRTELKSEITEVKVELVEMRQFFGNYFEKVNQLLQSHDQRIIALEAKAF